MQLALFRVTLGTKGNKLLQKQPITKDEGGILADEKQLKTLITTMKLAVVGEVNNSYEYPVFHL